MSPRKRLSECKASLEDIIGATKKQCRKLCVENEIISSSPDTVKSALTLETSTTHSNTFTNTKLINADVNPELSQETDSDKDYTPSVEDYGNRDVTFKFPPSMEIVFGKFLQYLISPDGVTESWTLANRMKLMSGKPVLF